MAEAADGSPFALKQVRAGQASAGARFRLQREHTEPARDERFALDSHLQALQPRSLLCLPARKREQVLGVVYQENRSTAHAFSRQRLRELELARGVAESATRAKSDFLANTSHEIRTPMNAILGMTHLALRSGLDARQHNYVLKAERSARSLLGLINDILDFSKIEAGKLDMEAVDFSLADVLDQFTDLIGPKADDKGLELVFDGAPDVPARLLGDPLRLTQVLVNLGSNAVKFTERGEVVVRVEVAERSAQAVRLRFSVRDSGPGHDDGAAAQALPALRTGRHLHHAALRRHRAGAGDQPAPGGADGRQHRRLGRGGQRQRIPFRRALRPVGVACAGHAGACPVLLTTSALARNELAQRVALSAAGPRITLLAKPVTARTMRAACLEALGEAPAAASAGAATGASVGAPPDASASASASAPTATRAALAASERRARLAGARVLLVEDNEINQELALELLGGEGLVVTVAEHGRQAMERLEKEDFDVVLMDCQMPVLDGYEATREIRARARWQSLPVIAMTAHAMVGDRDKALAAGMNGHIAKPLDVDAMFVTISRWLER